MKILGTLLQLPAWLLIAASFLGGIYAAYNKISGITYSTPIILFIIIVLYITGRILNKRKDKNNV